MYSIANMHFEKNKAKSRNKAVIDKEDFKTISEVVQTSSYSIFANQTSFVIVGRDNTMPEILGYSETSFEKDNLAPGLKWWLNAIEHSVNSTAENTRGVSNNVEYIPIENFIETTWSQGDPYNSLCPLIDGKKPQTGCVATAMAQVLYYCKYPEKSSGTGYYKTNANETEHKEFLSTVFNWDAMRPSYAVNDYSEESKTAVAELMRDCGLATGMRYGVGSSGAQSRVAANGFINNLGFSTLGLRFADRTYYSDEEWMGIVYEELASKRPIYYGGADLKESSGHAFVLSGVDSEGRVYVNWGWGGSGNGYYDIKSLAPNVTGINSNFSDQQDMIYGITPHPEQISSVVKCSEFIAEYEYDLETYEALKGYVRVVLPQIYNGYINGFRGKVSLCVENTYGKTTAYTLVEVKSPSIVPIYYAPNQSDYKSMLKDLGKLDPGTYKAYVGSKSEEDTKYQPLRCPNGPRFFSLVKDDEGTIEIFKGSPTGISSICSNKHSQSYIYDLQGQNLGTSTDAQPKGIYIIGGKKVVK